MPWDDAVADYISQAHTGVEEMVEKYEKVRKAIDLPPPFSVDGLAKSVIEQHQTSIAAMLKADDNIPAEYVRLFQHVLDA